MASNASFKDLNYDQKLTEAVRYIRSISRFRPTTALILGSGLGDFASRVEAVSIISASEIPYYPISSVHGHAGKLIFGHIETRSSRSVPLLIFQGRVHFYETGSLEQTIFPVFLASRLGIKCMIITNSAGGINANFNPGDLMLIKDISSFALRAPYISSHTLTQKHFSYFDPKMQNTLLESALKQNLRLHTGTYCWLPGPSYETPAEIRMIKFIGADAVGMSTVPEICTAYDLGMKIAGVSLISNLAAGLSLKALSHSEVTETGNRVSESFSEFLQESIFALNI